MLILFRTTLLELEITNSGAKFVSEFITVKFVNIIWVHPYDEIRETPLEIQYNTNLVVKLLAHKSL